MKRNYDIETLIRFLGERMESLTDADPEESCERTFSERLRLLETIGRTCSRIATLIAQQEKSGHNGTERLNQVLAQVLAEFRGGANES